MKDPMELCQEAVDIYPENPAEAYRLFSEAAAQGFPNGVFGMAELKASGIGTE